MVIWGNGGNGGNGHRRRGYPVVKEGVMGVVFYGYPWFSVVIRGFLWLSMDYCSCPWLFSAYNRSCNSCE